MPLVERQEQLSTVSGAWRDARAGRGQVVLVTGGAGSGKTALLEAFADEVHSAGGRTLSTDGSFTGRGTPLASIAQLFEHAAVPDAVTDRVRRMILAVTSRPPTGGTDPLDPHAANGPALTALLGAVVAALFALAGVAPLCIVIDGLHEVDAMSLFCLTHLARRIRRAPIMLVLAESPQAVPTRPEFRAELLSSPHLCRIALPPLSEKGLAELIAEHTDPVTAHEIAGEAHRTTGGSPLLARAFVDDWLAEHTRTPGVAGHTFDQAVLSCLYRQEPQTRAVAHAAAVLGRPAPPETIGQMLDIVPEAVTRAMRVLESAGLADGDRLRHRRISERILAAVPDEQRRDLHRRAATALFAHSASPDAVAGQLVSAGWAGASWAVSSLHEAAEHELSRGRADRANVYLHLAQRGPLDPRQRAAARMMLLHARWQLNPRSAAPQLDEIVLRLRRGAPASEAASAVPYLLWQGRVEDATEALRLRRPDTASPARIRIAEMLLALMRPGSGDPDRPGEPGLAESAVHPCLDAIGALGTALEPGRAAEAAQAADLLLSRYRPTSVDPAVLAPAVAALTYAGCPASSLGWLDELATDDAVAHRPTWTAVLHALRAEALLRTGSLTGAAHHASAALTGVSPHGWGVAVGVPLATLVYAATTAGRLDDAEKHLARPVPEAMFRTPFGLPYLQAAARHHLATGRARTAANELRLCGSLMTRWGMDTDGLVPWRLELARVELHLGQRAAAAELVRAQLDRLDDRRPDEAARHHARTRGVAMRLLAATLPAHQRGPLLSEAADLLEGAGDRLELACALADQGHALRAAGDGARGRLRIRRAAQLAEECGAEPIGLQLLRGGSGRAEAAPVEKVAEPTAPAEPTVLVPRGSPAERCLDELTDAERRVAMLAAHGYTNKQISGRLYITVSTVEQHLTRIYRKLKVKRRSSLAAELLGRDESGLDDVS
ncbi:LuxR family transcriptional regulator [Micromonospora sp. WMMD998]|uniref:helix-turn-helix transcriptional regulator n=1 Tax=Micromonospora sp. WMMD998 TaxID=3016092 RepID=UPI00249AC303|nr:LuxR family transcriptional regulator [Micromonospora sp. WMMD998]WFE39918.1 AAA family ATPase [Micromonospora sp. WMMD998]